jgi:hypothetical protein
MTEPSRTPAEVLEAAAELVAADDLDPIAAINIAAHGDPETRTGGPVAAEATAALMREIPEDQRPEWPITSPESVLGHWTDQVGPEEIAPMLRRAAQSQRTNPVYG